MLKAHKFLFLQLHLKFVNPQKGKVWSETYSLVYPRQESVDKGRMALYTQSNHITYIHKILHISIVPYITRMPCMFRLWKHIYFKILTSSCTGTPPLSTTFLWWTLRFIALHSILCRHDWLSSEVTLTLNAYGTTWSVQGRLVHVSILEKLKCFC